MHKKQSRLNPRLTKKKYEYLVLHLFLWALSILVFMPGDISLKKNFPLLAAINSGILRLLFTLLPSNKHGFDTPNRLCQIYFSHIHKNPICMPQMRPKTYQKQSKIITTLVIFKYLGLKKFNTSPDLVFLWLHFTIGVHSKQIHNQETESEILELSIQVEKYKSS